MKKLIFLVFAFWLAVLPSCGGSADADVIKGNFSDIITKGPWVDVRAFGADNTGVADSTAAFHSAMNAGKHVLVPQGTYAVNIDLTQVTNPGGLILEGIGFGNNSNGTVLTAFDNTLPVIKGLMSSIIRKIEFRNLNIYESGAAGTGNHGMVFDNVYEATYYKVYWTNLGGYSLKLSRSVAHTLIDCQMYKGSSSIGLGGMYADTQSNLINVFGGRYSGSGTSETTNAFTFAGQIGSIKLVGPSVESWGTGIVLNNTAGKITDVFIDGHFETNNTADVQVGVKDSSAANYLTGIRIKGTYVGPVAETGYSVELWGRKIFGVDIQPGYVTNRTAVVNLYSNVEYYNTTIAPAYNLFVTDAGYIPLYDGTLVSGISVSAWGQKQQAAINFTANDATPSVLYGSLFRTVNTGATTITTFDNGVNGQVIDVVFTDNITTIDFTGSGLKGHGGVDWGPPIYESMRCVYLTGTGKWHCIVSDNTSR